jgi:alpha-ketoglutarate-dependent taurine dioxygenase
MEHPSKPRPIARERRAIAATAEAIVSYEPLFAGSNLPLLCKPRLAGVNLASWGERCRAELERRLIQHGALLFRGFDVPDVKDFDACVQAISGGAVQYMFRASPRTQVDDRFNVYTSTDYPAAERIFPHNEHSYSPVFPRELYFYCALPSITGGETPIGDTRLVLGRIHPEVRERFQRDGVMYVRNYGDGMGLPWQTVFQTSERSEVEAYCRSVGIVPEWKSGDRLRTRQVGPAVVRHPVSGEAVWFNHATFFHALTLPQSVRANLLEDFGPEDLPQNTFYGDGRAIDAEVIQHLQDVYRTSMIEFPWQAGDVLLLDNILALHARNAFTGPRRILTAMAKPQRSADLRIEARDQTPSINS